MPKTLSNPATKSYSFFKDYCWHIKRAGFSPDKLCLPSRDWLKTIRLDGLWVRSDPWTTHPFSGE